MEDLRKLKSTIDNKAQFTKGDKQRILSSIYNGETNNKQNILRKNILRNSIAAVIIILSSTLVIYITPLADEIYKLFNNKGEMVLELKEQDDPFDEGNREILDKIKSQLHPGQYQAVFIDGKYYTTGNPIKYQSIESLEEQVNVQFKQPSFLPNGYSFVYGKGIYKTENPDFGPLQEEADQTGEKIVTKDIALTDELWYLYYRYMEDENFIGFMIDYSNPGSTFLFDHLEDVKVEKLLVNGIEAFYIEDGNINYITWYEEVENGEQILFEINTNPESGLSKFDLQMIAESMEK